jgi:hypothetical protein
MNWNIDRSFKMPRKWSNQVLREIAPTFTGEVINVSGWQDNDKEGNRYKTYFSNASKYFVSNFVGARGVDDSKEVTDFEIDLEAVLEEELVGRFDVVFNHTTLEHIFEVRKAFANLCSMSKDVVIVIVPFAQEVHFNESYGDFWRFTPMSLRRLFEDNGCSVVFESANKNVNSGIYVLSVGSKHPERWQGKLPAYSNLDKLGNWIGWNPLRKIFK